MGHAAPPAAGIHATTPRRAAPDHGLRGGPGVLRVFGIVPGIGPLILLAVSVWMLVAMVIAVRQALDFTSTGRALMVCAVGWVITLVMLVLLGGFLGPVAP